MARTKILIVTLFTQILTLATSQPWYNYNRLNCHSYSPPIFRPFGGNPFNGLLLFMDARPYLNVFPQDEDPPTKPDTDAVYTPEPKPVSNKTKAILHKLHQTVKELLESEDEDNGITEESSGTREVIIEPRSVGLTQSDDTYNQTDSYDDDNDGDNDDDVTQDKKSKNKIVNTDNADDSENSISCYSDELSSDSDNIIKINISIMRCSSD